jgi:nucleoside-diphosphate-sugar epimerase
MSMGQFFYEPIQNLITKPDWKSQNQLFEFYQHNVDVRDVAEAHVRAMESPVAGGERFIVSNSESLFCTSL